jgi:hypothetical protein
MSSVQPRCSAGTSVAVPRSAALVDPSAWMRRKSAACARFAISARATLPMLVPAVRVRVITTWIPAPRRSVRSRRETAIVTTDSGVPVVVPRVPPPSLIFRVAEPGPIGSVAVFRERSWPGSTTTVGGGAAASAAAARRTAGASTPDSYLPASGARRGRQYDRPR